VPISDSLSETQASNNVSDNDVELLTERSKSQVTNSDSDSDCSDSIADEVSESLLYCGTT